MRFLTLPTLTILAGGLVFAAESANITYIDGNLADLTPNSGATLNMNNEQSMELETPLHKVKIPYAQISNTEMGKLVTHAPAPEPLYKVWTLPKRLVKPESRQMTVAFTNENGQNQTMTIELSRTAADEVFATIERHSPKVANSSWWGDKYWKTGRNRDTWGGAGIVAQK